MNKLSKPATRILLFLYDEKVAMSSADIATACALQNEAEWEKLSKNLIASNLIIKDNWYFRISSKGIDYVEDQKLRAPISTQVSISVNGDIHSGASVGLVTNVQAENIAGRDITKESIQAEKSKSSDARGGSLGNYAGEYAKSYALVVGIEEYDHLPTLRGAQGGASEVAELFEEVFGFQTTKMFNCNAEKRNVINWFYDLIECEVDDLVVFYFAGHRLTLPVGRDKVEYLAFTHTTEIDHESALEISDIVKNANRLPAKHVLLILDAHFNIPLWPYDIDEMQYDEVNIARLVSSPVRYMIVDGAKHGGNYQHFEFERKRSLFTHYLLEGLLSEAYVNGYLSASRLGSYITDKVSQDKKLIHTPKHGTLSPEWEGDFIFNLEPQHFPSPKCTILNPQDFAKASHAYLIGNLQKTQTLQVIKQITEGQSGSAVYLVLSTDESAQSSPRLCYCKIYRTPSGAEQEKYKAAKSSPLGQYMPEMIDHAPSPPNRKWTASLYAVAHDKQAASISLRQLIDNPKLARDNIVKLLDILAEWNTAIKPKHFQYPHLIIDPIPHSLKKTISDIQDLLSEKLDVDYLFLDFGERLPNPLAYISNSKLWPSEISQTALIGHVHGDLHTNNVMCAVDEQFMYTFSNPVILDFDTYQSDKHRFFDLAYLELDIILQIFSTDVSVDRLTWLKISKYLVENIKLEEPRLRQALPSYFLLQPMREFLYDKFHEEYYGLNFDIAFWVARISAGLAFARKRKLYIAERKLMLLAAAHSLQKVLSRLQLEYPQIEFSEYYKKSLDMNWLVGSEEDIRERRVRM